MHIIFATTSSGTLADAVKAHEEIKEAYPEIELSLFLMEDSLNEQQWSRFERVSKEADLFLYDPHGAESQVVVKMSEIAEKYNCDQLPLMLNGAKWEKQLRFGDVRREDIQLDRRSGEMMLVEQSSQESQMDIQEKRQRIQQYEEIKNYWHASSIENWKECLFFIANLYGKTDAPKAKAPDHAERTGVIDLKTGRHYSNAQVFLKETDQDLSKPKIIFLYIASQARVKSVDVLAELIERVKPVATVIPIGLTSIMKIDLEHLEHLLAGMLDEIQLIANFIGFRLGSGPVGGDREDVTEWLKKRNIPMLHPFFLTRTTIEEWEEAEGLSPVEAMVNVVLPELDGAVETYPIAAIQSAGFDQIYQFEKKELALIEESASQFTDRIKNWLYLREQQNSKKRLALIGYNYPPGEGNLFGGSFLDTFSSLSSLLKRLADEGYQVTPMSAEELESQFRNQQLFNETDWGVDEEEDQRVRYPVQKAAAGWRNIQERERMEHFWGRYPGEVMTDGEAFFIPGFINGNVFIGLQPSRGGADQDSSADYHDQSVPPHYQYQAFYTWLEKEFKTDAIVHIGTHGTLEYLPGKENGMSASCYPSQLIRTLPHFYFYYIGNPSEAMLAKRRTHAVLSSYMAPPFQNGGLYGDYEEIERLLHEYREAEQLDPLRCEEILKELQEIASENGFNEAADSDHFSRENLEVIEEELQRIQYALIPYGLHIIGEGLGHKEAIEHVVYTMRKEYKGHTLKQLIAQLKPKLQDDPALEKEGRQIIKNYVEAKTLPDTKEHHLREDFAMLLGYGEKVYQRVRETKELSSMIRSLNGGYLSAELSGDVYKNPESLPTGSNLYQFDPRAVPSPSAIQRGAEIAKATIAQHQEAKGDIPRTVACVLWGIETSRTQGETIGQILEYVGARAVKRSAAANTTFELIPLSELGRPRINVAVSMSGVFRDLFPNVIDTLNDLFQKLSLAEEAEEENQIRAFTLSVQAQLLKEGYSKEDAFDLASARIFGPASGEYGTGINHMIEDGAWTDEDELGELYKNHAHHVYSKLRRGESIPDLYDINMKAADIVSQLRASHEYQITDIDDYYNFFGGLAKSIEKAKGEKVEIYITDTSLEKPLTEDVKFAINRGVRTRLTNPKWIEGLMEHPYHGVQQMAKHTENLLGLAATTNKVENWIFSHVHETYIEDKELQEKIREANPHAYHDLLGTLVEVSDREYWKPTEAEWQSLKEAFLEAEASME